MRLGPKEKETLLHIIECARAGFIPWGNLYPNQQIKTLWKKNLIGLVQHFGGASVHPTPLAYEVMGEPVHFYLHKLGIPVHVGTNIDYVMFWDLREALNREGIAKEFGEFFGLQTMGEQGPYAHDCEAVLHRIYTGELVGTQLMMD